MLSCRRTLTPSCWREVAVIELRSEVASCSYHYHLCRPGSGDVLQQEQDKEVRTREPWKQDVQGQARPVPEDNAFRNAKDVLYIETVGEQDAHSYYESATLSALA